MKQFFLPILAVISATFTFNKVNQEDPEIITPIVEVEVQPEPIIEKTINWGYTDSSLVTPILKDVDPLPELEVKEEVETKISKPKVASKPKSVSKPKTTSKPKTSYSSYSSSRGPNCKT